MLSKFLPFTLPYQPYLPNPNQSEFDTFVLVWFNSASHCTNLTRLGTKHRNIIAKVSTLHARITPFSHSGSLEPVSFCLHSCLISAFSPGQMNYINLEKNAPRGPHTLPSTGSLSMMPIFFHVGEMMLTTIMYIAV